MKKLLLFTTLALSINAIAQTPNYFWAKSAGGNSNVEGNSVTTDASGNTIVTGYFSCPSITFGATTLTNTSSGYNDIFIVKYDGSGNVLWAKSAGGTGNENGKGVMADAVGNIIVTGYFQSPSITFGATTLTNASSGYHDIFIVKYDSSGNVLWAKSIGGTKDDESNSVTADAGGNIIVTGYFQSPSITLGTTTLTNTNSGTSDIFIVKFDGNGNVLWAKSAGGTNPDYSNSITADASGNIIVTGYFQSPSIPFGTTTLTNDTTNSSADIFIVKFDGNGNVLWAKSAGGTGSDNSYSVTADAIGNIIVMGYFNSSSITFGITTLTNSSMSIFIVKYNDNGNELWAKSVGAGTYYSNEGCSVTADASGNIIVTGEFGNPSITFGTTTLTRAGSTYDDIFIVKYDGSGNVLWAKSTGVGTGEENGKSVTADAAGNIIVTGCFNSSTIAFGTTTLTNAGGGVLDFFLAKLGCTSTFTQSPSICSGQNFTVGTHTYTVTGIYIDTLISYKSCDSIVTTNLTVLLANTFSQTITKCAGQSITVGIHTYTISGTYTDILTSYQSCDSTVTTHLTVVSPIVLFTATYDTLQNTFTLKLDSTVIAVANSYLWNFGDGSTSTLATPTHTYTTDTVYNVCLKITSATNDICPYCHIIGKDYLGHIYRTSGFTLNVVKSTVTGITSISSNENNVTIYPNPSSGIINVQLGQSEKSQIKISDILGNSVYQSNSTSPNFQIDLSAQTNGVYFISIQTNEGILNKKLVISK